MWAIEIDLAGIEEIFLSKSRNVRILENVTVMVALTCNWILLQLWPWVLRFQYNNNRIVIIRIIMTVSTPVTSIVLLPWGRTLFPWPSFLPPVSLLFSTQITGVEWAIHWINKFPLLVVGNWQDFVFWGKGTRTLKKKWRGNPLQQWVLPISKKRFWNSVQGKPWKSAWEVFCCVCVRLVPVKLFLDLKSLLAE